MNMNLILKVVQGVFFVAGAVLCGMTMFDTTVDGKNCVDCRPAEYSLILAYLLLGLSSFSWLLSFGTAIAKDPSKIKGILIWIGGLGAIFGLSYLALSTGADHATYTTETVTITETVSHLSGTGLFMAYILIVGAVLAIVYSSISRLIR